MLQQVETIDQSPAIDFLSDPATYDGSGAQVQRIDTHAAIVFLAGGFAYKIKRAVQLPYLDFRSLESRRQACTRELEVNAPWAADIYLDVVPIVRNPYGKFSLGGPGTVVEWAVKMKRFDEELLLDRIVQKQSVEPGVLNTLTDTIADRHAQVAIAKDADFVAGLKQFLDLARRRLARLSQEKHSFDASSLVKSAQKALIQNSPLLTARTAGGKVRRCHGDLHLANIVLLNGRPTPFDAIEFDETIATIDVLYDLAFLLMDLWRRGAKGEANQVFNRYLHITHDLDDLSGLAAMPLFMACRAIVRALVGMDRVGHQQGKAVQGTEAEIRSLLSAAHDFLTPPPASLVVIGGLSGTGKSTLAKALAPLIGRAPGAVVLRSDVERKQLFGRDELVRLGASYYTAAVTARVYQSLCFKAELILQAGQSVIVDAVYLDKRERDSIEELAKSLDIPFMGIWLEGSAKNLVERVEHRSNDASDADASIVETQLRMDPGKISWTKISSDGSTGDVLARAVGLVRTLPLITQASS